MHIKKKPISKRTADSIQQHFVNKEHSLKNNVYGLGVRFHGGSETSLESVRKEGLKREKANEPGAGIFFGDAENADTAVYSRGKNWSVVHSVPPEYLEGKPVLNGHNVDYHYVQNSRYAGYAEREALFNIPSQRIKTFVKNIINTGSYSKSDPLLYEIEKRMNKEGKTMGRSFEQFFDNPARLQHKINYYSLILADDAFEKNRSKLRNSINERLRKDGKVTFADMRKTASGLGIIPDLQDYVIGSAFLDMKLKKARNGFKK